MNFPIGTKVRVKGFPVSALDYNGLTGTIKKSNKVGLGLENKPVYAYEVFFEGVSVPYINRDPVTNKIERGTRVSNAQNWFEEIFLEQA